MLNSTADIAYVLGAELAKSAALRALPLRELAARLRLFPPPPRAHPPLQSHASSRRSRIPCRQVKTVRAPKFQVGFRYMRYRGITKTGAQASARLALTNLHFVRSRLAST